MSPSPNTRPYPCRQVDIKTLPKVLDTISNIYLQSITLNIVDGTEVDHSP